MTMFADDIAALRLQLDARDIEHRSVISGNFLRHPVSNHYQYTAGPMPNADYVSDHALMIGNHAYPIDWSCLDGITSRRSQIETAA